MYFYIKKYAAEYEIPEAYAFSLAYQETRYQGPLDLDYNHKQTSYAGALGPMQIMPSTAKMIYGKSVSNYNLKNDIKLNVMISMKLLRRLRNTYGNWGVVFGAYNTGRPCINGYAKNILDKQYIWEM
jgi:soluble lytic murein transglycosylase-like protein